MSAYGSAFSTWKEAHASAQEWADRLQRSMGIEKNSGTPGYGPWYVRSLPKPENRYGPDLRCEVVEPMKGSQMSTLRLKLKPYPKKMTLLGEPFDPATLDPYPGGPSTRGSHRRVAFTKCEMRGALRYFYGFRQEWEVEYRALGSLGHLHLAFHYGKRLENPPRWTTDPIERYEEKILEGTSTANFQKWTTQIRAAIRTYVRRWASDVLVPLAVETELVATLGEVDPGGDESIAPDSEIVTVRYDLLGLKGGKVIDVDHKFSAGNRAKGQLAKFTPEEFDSSRQILEQIAIMNARLDMPIGGAAIRRTMREPPFESDHQPLSPSPTMLKAIGPLMRAGVGRELEAHARRGDRQPMRLQGLATDACAGDRYGACDYLIPCRNPPRDRLVILKNDFKRGEAIYQRGEDRT